MKQVLGLTRSHGSAFIPAKFSPDPLLGNWAKSFHPQNVEVVEFVNIFMNVPQGGKLCFMTRKRS
jgi:hypothetical protein